jgi:predicted small secreted protein
MEDTLMKVTKRLISALLLLTMIATLAACNTIRGVGRDVEASGEAIQEVTR